jgi:hypothetical protein
MASWRVLGAVIVVWGVVTLTFLLARVISPDQPVRPAAVRRGHPGSGAALARPGSAAGNTSLGAIASATSAWTFGGTGIKDKIVLMVAILVAARSACGRPGCWFAWPG